MILCPADHLSVSYPLSSPPQDGPILGAVGAYGWSGGISVYTAGQQNGVFINNTKDQTDMKDSYMGEKTDYLLQHKTVIVGQKIAKYWKFLVFFFICTNII